MDIITMHLVFSHMSGRREDIFGNLTFYFLRIWYCLWSSWGGKALNFTIPLTMIDTCNNWPYTFQEVKNVKLLTHDGRRPFAIGHPSESGDLKKLSCLKMEDTIVVTTEILSKRDPIIVHVNRNVKISSESSEENADPQTCWLERKRQERMIVSCFCLILYKIYIYSFCI